MRALACIILTGVIPLSGCAGAIVPASAVISAVATVADTTKHWNDECRIPPGKQAIESAKKILPAQEVE